MKISKISQLWRNDKMLGTFHLHHEISNQLENKFCSYDVSFQHFKTNQYFDGHV